MAHLNKREKLILKAVNGENALLSKALNDTISYFKANAIMTKKYDDIKIINYLYFKNHESLSFQRIADELFISLSTLEDRRSQYVKIFLYFLETYSHNGQIENEIALSDKSK